MSERIYPSVLFELLPMYAGCMHEGEEEERRGEMQREKRGRRSGEGKP